MRPRSASLRIIRKGWPACPGITPWWAGCHPLEHLITIADIGRGVLVTARSLASSRVGSSGLYARAAALQTGSPPSRGLHLIVSIQPVKSIRAARDDLTRSVGVDSCRSGVSPHRTQAPSRSWPPVTLPPLPATPFWRLSAPALPAPVQQGPVSDAFPAFIGAPPGSPAPVRERDASEGA